MIEGFKILYKYNDGTKQEEEYINLIIKMLTNFTQQLLLYTNNSKKIIQAFRIVYEVFHSNSSNIQIINIIKPFFTIKYIETIIEENISTEGITNEGITKIKEQIFRRVKT